MAFYEGKNSSLTWSATSQPGARFELDFKSEIIDTTNFTSGGQQSNLAGIGSADGSMEGPYNGSLGLTSGGLLTITFATGGGGPSWAMPMRNSSIKISSQVRNEAVRFAVQMTSSGTFTITV